LEQINYDDRVEHSTTTDVKDVNEDKQGSFGTEFLSAALAARYKLASDKASTPSSIPRHMDFHAAPRNLPLATEFAACCGKMRNCLFLLHLYLIQGYSDYFLILPFIKQ